MESAFRDIRESWTWIWKLSRSRKSICEFRIMQLSSFQLNFYWKWRMLKHLKLLNESLMRIFVLCEKCETLSQRSDKYQNEVPLATSARCHYQNMKLNTIGTFASSALHRLAPSWLTWNLHKNSVTRSFFGCRRRCLHQSGRQMIGSTLYADFL